MSQKGYQKRRRFFQQGAEAFQWYTGCTAIYICPLCGENGGNQSLTSQEAIDAGWPTALNLEHVPPKCIGGKEMVLTCLTCNGKAGRTIDAALKDRENIHRSAEVLAHNAPGKVTYASLSSGGERIKVECSYDGSGIGSIKILEKSNDPAILKRLYAYWERETHDSAGDGVPFSLSVKARYSDRLASVSNLKSAFLAAFAAFGYRYAFDPRLQPVRRQIRNPCDRVIERWEFALLHAESSRFIGLLESPPGVFVNLSHMGVLLPWLDSPVDFYQQLAATWQPDAPIQLRGRMRVEWPTEMVMALDYWLLSHLSDLCASEARINGAAPTEL